MGCASSKNIDGGDQIGVVDSAADPFTTLPPATAEEGRFGDTESLPRTGGRVDVSRTTTPTTHTPHNHQPASAAHDGRSSASTAAGGCCIDTDGAGTIKQTTPPAAVPSSPAAFFELLDVQTTSDDSTQLAPSAELHNTSARPTEAESRASVAASQNTRSNRCLFRGNAVHLRCSRPDHAGRTREWVVQSQERHASAISRRLTHHHHHHHHHHHINDQPLASMHGNVDRFRSADAVLEPHEEPLFDIIVPSHR